MHGCGNDFVVLDERARPRSGFRRRRRAGLADRRTGIGCDQLITTRSRRGWHRPISSMRIRNPDGSEAGACGNATRCIAAFSPGKPDGSFVIRTRPAILGHVLAPIELASIWDRAAGLGRGSVGAGDRHAAPAVDRRGGRPIRRLSMGNPHATFFVPESAAVPMRSSAPFWSTTRCFRNAPISASRRCWVPDRPSGMWERGAGLTLACGSGACAALVNASPAGVYRADATLVVDGGELVIAWPDNGRVLMTGPVATAFTGDDRSAMSVEVLTFGCRLNAYEAEMIRGHASDGCRDTVVMNACAVTAEAERQARQAIRRAVRTPGAPSWSPAAPRRSIRRRWRSCLA